MLKGRTEFAHEINDTPELYTRIMLRYIAEILGSEANFLTSCNVSALGSGIRW